MKCETCGLQTWEDLPLIDIDGNCTVCGRDMKRDWTDDEEVAKAKYLSSIDFYFHL